jgi:hypothetical protein
MQISEFRSGTGEPPDTIIRNEFRVRRTKTFYHYSEEMAKRRTFSDMNKWKVRFLYNLGGKHTD